MFIHRSVRLVDDNVEYAMMMSYLADNDFTRTFLETRRNPRMAGMAMEVSIWAAPIANYN